MGSSSKKKRSARGPTVRSFRTSTVCPLRRRYPGSATCIRKQSLAGVYVRLAGRRASLPRPQEPDADADRQRGTRPFGSLVEPTNLLNVLQVRGVMDEHIFCANCIELRHLGSCIPHRSREQGCSDQNRCDQFFGHWNLHFDPADYVNRGCQSWLTDHSFDRDMKRSNAGTRP